MIPSDATIAYVDTRRIAESTPPPPVKAVKAVDMVSTWDELVKRMMSFDDDDAQKRPLYTSDDDDFVDLDKDFVPKKKTTFKKRRHLDPLATKRTTRFKGRYFESETYDMYM
jgi:hypothetical protein